MEKEEEAGLEYDGCTMWRKTYGQLEKSGRGTIRMEETCRGGQSPSWHRRKKKGDKIDIVKDIENV